VLGLEGVGVPEGRLLRRAEGGCDRIATDTGYAAIRVCNDLAILLVKAADFNKVTTRCVSRRNELCDDPTQGRTWIRINKHVKALCTYVNGLDVSTVKPVP
jgi:hypothetical protein